MTKGKKNCTDVYKALYDYVYYCVARRYLKEKKRTEGGRKINEQSLVDVRSIKCSLLAMYKTKKKTREKEKIVVVPMSYITIGQKD